MLRRHVILLAMMLALGGCIERPDPNVDKGDALPEMKLRDLSGTVIHSGELFAGKVVVLNIWATWCPPCRKEMPDLIRLSRILPNDRFMVAALSVDNNPDDVRAFVDEHGIDFPVFVDPGGKGIVKKKWKKILRQKKPV